MALGEDTCKQELVCFKPTDVLQTTVVNYSELICTKLTVNLQPIRQIRILVIKRINGIPLSQNFLLF